ncbi:uncharacterized protein LOC122661730 [Telopea speciosissima]|uniref:uncharacterized protein LOC122661730 n=1 Tax=Telopea speciosissima TaxID=54955 RepID=UPI001CC4C78B|nr:uncharacterized protein LOC122661730 [Telopea speciosissima]
MDCFDFDNVKAEKAKAMQRYLRLRKMANLFLYVEVCIALLLLSWFSTRLPVAVRISGEYFRGLCLILVSPRFVFLAGNAIILTLFAKSGQFSALGLSTNTSGTDDIYDEFVKNNTDNQSRQKPLVDDNPAPAPAPAPKEFVFEDKEMVHQEEEKVNMITNAYRQEEEEEVVVVASSESKIIFRRSQSENLKLKLKNEADEKPRRELRRSETEKCRIVGSDTEKASSAVAVAPAPVPYSNVEDEEFRRTIEAFIERQQKFQREESLAMVLQNNI